MEIMRFNGQVLGLKPFTGTVRSIKRKKQRQHLSAANVHSLRHSVDAYQSNPSPDCVRDDEYVRVESVPPQLVWNASGWIRVYCGPYRDVIDYEEPSRMVHVSSVATTADICLEMDLPSEYTIWVWFY